jgi:hypothetical protein
MRFGLVKGKKPYLVHWENNRAQLKMNTKWSQAEPLSWGFEILLTYSSAAFSLLLKTAH